MHEINIENREIQTVTSSVKFFKIDIMITSYFAPKKNSKRPAATNAPSTASDSNKKKSSPAAIITPRSSSSLLSIASTSTTSSKKGARTTKSSIDEDASKSSSAKQLASNLDASVDWTNSPLTTQFDTHEFQSLSKFITQEYSLLSATKAAVYPPPSQICAALNLTPLHKVKVVIVGQDPYHQPNQGHGLAFSVPRGIQIPPSLRNIYKELLNDHAIPEFTSMPSHGNLTRWAKQGVLLLNNVLTVRRGEPASHAKRGWEEFTDAVIDVVVKRDNDDNYDGNEGSINNKNKVKKGKGVVFLLWGKPASLKAQTILSKQQQHRHNTGNNKNQQQLQQHAVIMCSHPSPLGATKTATPFMGSKCFSRANDELRKRGWGPIDWRVDGPLNEVEEEVGKTEKEEDGDEGYDDDKDVEC